MKKKFVHDDDDDDDDEERPNRISLCSCTATILLMS